MRKVYGDSLRKEAGLTKTIKNAAMKNVKLFNLENVSETPYGKVAQELTKTVDRVYGDAVGVVNDFIAECERRRARCCGMRVDFGSLTAVSL